MATNIATPQYTVEGILPPHAYFDPRWHEIANRNVYSKAPVYVGHVSMVPTPGMYAVAHDPKKRLLLTRDKAGKVRCFDNRCRHQGAMLIDPVATPVYSSPEEYGKPESLKRDEPCGNRLTIVCPIHQWAWELNGTLRGAPHFDLEELPQDRKCLKEHPVRIWNGLIFKNVGEETPLPWEGEIEAYHYAEHLDLSNYVLECESKTEYPCSMHVFNKVYFDDRHVRIGHRVSFGAMMDMSALNLYEAKHFNVQEVGFLTKPFNKMCPEYEAWHRTVLRIMSGSKPEFGALWSFFYPNFMIEVYPFSVVVSIMDPVAVNRSINRCYHFYPKDLREAVHGALILECGKHIERGGVDDLCAYFKRADFHRYARTGAEDFDFVMRIAHGLHAAYEAGEDFRGLPHPVEEKGILAYDRYFSVVESEYRKQSG